MATMIVSAGTEPFKREERRRERIVTPPRGRRNFGRTEGLEAEAGEGRGGRKGGGFAWVGGRVRSLGMFNLGGEGGCEGDRIGERVGEWGTSAKSIEEEVDSSSSSDSVLVGAWHRG